MFAIIAHVLLIPKTTYCIIQEEITTDLDVVSVKEEITTDFDAVSVKEEITTDLDTVSAAKQ